MLGACVAKRAKAPSPLRSAGALHKRGSLWSAVASAYSVFRILHSALCIELAWPERRDQSVESVGNGARVGHGGPPIRGPPEHVRVVQPRQALPVGVLDGITPVRPGAEFERRPAGQERSQPFDSQVAQWVVRVRARPELSIVAHPITIRVETGVV